MLSLPRLTLPLLAAPALALLLAAPRPPAPLDDLLLVSAVAFPSRASAYLGTFLAQPTPDQQLAIETCGQLLSPPAQAPTQTRCATLLGAILAAPTVPEPQRLAAQAALVKRLEARTDPGSRWATGPDLIAARALDRSLPQGRPKIQALLTSLAAGDAPHPSLAVRVECADVALGLAPAPEPALTSFLLSVLRAETPDQTKSPRTWPRLQTVAWVKTRAAAALARHTGLENRFRPDGSWAHQTAEADRFEAAL